MEKHHTTNLAKHQKLMLNDNKLVKMQLAEVQKSNKELQDKLKKAYERIEALTLQTKNPSRPKIPEFMGIRFPDSDYSD